MPVNRRYRLAAACLAILAAATFFAPQSQGVEGAQGQATSGVNAQGKPLLDVAIPPGVDVSLIQPRTGAALDRARLPLSKIVSEIRRPAYLPKATAAPDNNDPAARLEQRIATLKATLAQKPKDRTAATELLRLYLVDQDDPAAALPLLELGADLKTRVHLPLAVKPMGELKEAELLDLAIWYQEMGNRTKEPAGEKMLRRAYDYYEAFLESHTAADLQNATARVALMKVHEALEARKAAGAGDAKPKGPSLHVQRSYARARIAWREGQPHAAINLLEAANNLAPNQPEILRLLAHIYFSDLRNAVQGAHYTKLALAQNPGDLDSLYMLGRYEFLHLRQWDSAIAVFAHALTVEDKEADPAIKLLIHHYLSRALQNEGYDAASIVEFENFLAAADKLHRPTEYRQELALFERTLPLAWQQVGDAHNRLNDPLKAIAAYEEADQLDSEDRIHLVNRIAYTQLRLGDAQAALEAVIELLKESDGDARSLAMMNYLVAAGADAGKLAAQLGRIYIELKRPAALALALANMQGGDQGRLTLRDHVLQSPTDRDVYQQWLEENFASKNTSAPADAVRLTAQLIGLAPLVAERYGDLMLDAAPDPQAIITAIEAFDAAERDKPVVRLIKAMAFLRADRNDEAIEAFAAAAAGDPTLIAAQASLVKLLLDRREYERAAKAIETIKDGADARILPLRIRLLRETNKITQAIALLDGLTPQQRREPQIILEKAVLQRVAGDTGGAVQTLEDGLTHNGTSELLYEALLDMLDGIETPDAHRQIIRVTERMLRQLPNSPLAQVRKAHLMIRARDIDGAERVLLEVQRTNPTEGRSLGLLMQILYFTERKPLADELIAGRLKDHPQSDEVAGVALQLARLHIFQTGGDPAKAIDLLTKLLANRTTVRDPRNIIILTRMAMVRSKKFDNIDAFFQKVVDDYPKHAADILADWALTWEYAGDKAKSEKLLAQALEKDPNHAKANNALGYSWADQGIHLDKAEKMIAIALKDEPDNSAYLDSMGWVKYKQGKFDEAVKYLQKAIAEEGGDHAVILDHLGDALYRANRKDEARKLWLDAQRSIDPAELEMDAELRRVEASLREKIAAMRAQKEPVTAAVPGQDEKQE